MTTTYNPRDRSYTDEYDVRLEVARVFDVCAGCQKCVSLCPTFPALISTVESKPDADAGRLTPDEQDEIINECFRCSLCSSSCPYLPGLHEFEVDFPRLVDRYRAMQRAQKKWSLRSSVGRVVIGRSTSIVRFIVRHQPNGVLRRIFAWTMKISRIELRNDQSREQWSSWVESGARLSTKTDSRIALFPTCVVAAASPHMVQQIIETYDSAGVGCSLVGEKLCCGAPALLHGESKFFRKNASRVIDTLTKVYRDGAEIVVADPRCCNVIVRDYPHYIDTEESRILASHVSVVSGIDGVVSAHAHAWWGLHNEQPSPRDRNGPDFIKKPPTD